MARTFRHPAVAGRFYPRDPQDLRADVESFLPPNKKPLPLSVRIVPHAGYIYPDMWPAQYMRDLTCLNDAF